MSTIHPTQVTTNETTIPNEAPLSAIVQKGQGLYDVLEAANYKFPPKPQYTPDQAARVVALMTELNPQLKKDAATLQPGWELKLPTEEEFAKALQPPKATAKEPISDRIESLTPYQGPLYPSGGVSIPPPTGSNQGVQVRQKQPPPEAQAQEKQGWERALDNGEFAQSVASLLELENQDEKIEGLKRVAQKASESGLDAYPSAVWAMSELHKLDGLGPEFIDELKKIQREYDAVLNPANGKVDSEKIGTIPADAVAKVKELLGLLE